MTATSRDGVLLGAALALSAGLRLKFDQRFLAAQFSELRRHLETVTNVHRGLLRDHPMVKFDGVDEIAFRLDALKTQRVIFAGSQFGPLLASVAALGSINVKVAGVYWTLAENNRRILKSCGAHFIDLTEYGNWRSMIRSLQQLHASGYVLWLMCDVKGRSRIHYDFLGYSVPCATLIEVYAKLSKCIVIPAYCRVVSNNEVSLHCGPNLTDHENITQRLLSDLEYQIYADPINYLWSDASIIFSDRRALQKGLSILPAFLEWRQQVESGENRTELGKSR
jgi:lauroyl/myristoyl acyltransferase